MLVRIALLCLCASYALALHSHGSSSVTKINATIRSNNYGLRQQRFVTSRSGQQSTYSKPPPAAEPSHKRVALMPVVASVFTRPTGILFGYSLVRWLTTIQLHGVQLIKPLGAVPLVGLLASTFIPHAGAAIYCGAFAALTNLPTITSMGTWYGIPLALMVVTVLSHEVWERCGVMLGYGGRIGCSAACGIGLLVLAKSAGGGMAVGLTSAGEVAALITKMPLLAIASLHTLPSTIRTIYSTIKVEELVKAALLTLIGATATIALRMLPPKIRRGSIRAARSNGHSYSHNNTTVSSAANRVAPKAVALSALQASCIATVLSARVLRAHEIAPIFTSLSIKSGEIFTLDPRGLVLMGSFLGMRDGIFTASYLRRTVLQCLVSTCLIFGLNFTPMGRVGGILGMTAIVSTLVVDTVCDGARAVKGVVADRRNRKDRS